MKTKIVLSVLLSFAFYFGTAQVPQGFNYQAIARNPADGTPIIDKPMTVRLTIQSDSLAGGGNIIFWQEVHSVTTNSYGLINLIVGKGTKVQGTEVTFSAIDWHITPKFIKTEIDYNGWKTMGSSRLWTVPYSMIAGDLGGAVKKLEVLGEDVASDDALFEVKRKDGETMFAVYNYGVRVFMPLDTLSKARKGGFAVGGFSKVKGTIQNYFVVNPDSIRAYIDTNPDKARKGGFAVGGFDKAKAGNEEYLRVTRDSTRVYINDDTTKARKGGFAVGGFSKAKGANASFLDVATDATGIINPSQNRILWYPIKNAFLTGKVLIQKPDSVGVNSFATGYESKAKGQYSQALGYKAIARGDYSTAIGKNAIANSINSFSFGDGSKSIKNDSYAFGAGANAQGIGSYAFGSAGRDTSGNFLGTMTTASGDYSIAIGQGAMASNLASFSFGSNTIASGKGSTAIGYFTTASGRFSTTMGAYTTASGYYSTSLGEGTTASGSASTAIGQNTFAGGDRSFAMGDRTLTRGSYSTAMGSLSSTLAGANGSIAAGYRSVTDGVTAMAIGWEAYAIGNYATSLGAFTKSKPRSCLAIGEYNDTTCSVSGKTTWILSDPIFMVGIGTANNDRRNALTILKSGYVGIGITNPSYQLHIKSITNAIICFESLNWSTGYAGEIRFGDSGHTIRGTKDGIDFNDANRFRFIGASVGIDRNPVANKLEVEGNASKTTSGGWLANSDIRIKTQIRDIENAQETILKLHPVLFKYTEEWKKIKPSIQDKFYYNFIAQEFREVFPESVQSSGEYLDGQPGELLQMDSYNAQIVAIKALQEVIRQNEEQQKQIDSYKSENENLKSQLQLLQERMDKIEVLLSKVFDK